MSSLVGQFALVPPDLETFSEVKKYCGAKLVEEIREKFSMPYTMEMDKIIFYILGNKYRSFKYGYKNKLMKKAKAKLKEIREKSGDYIKGEEDKYTKDQLLEALDLLTRPCGFVDHQWERFKSNLRSDKAKVLSKKGRKARGTQIHTRIIGAISFARKKDEFQLKKKRKPTKVEFFGLAYKKKDGTYIQRESQLFMDNAKELAAKKTLELGMSGPIDSVLESEIHSAVWKELMVGDTPRRPINYGVGVTNSQVSKLNDDLRKMRPRSSSVGEVQALVDKVNGQEKQIEGMQITMKELQIQIQFLCTAIGFPGRALTHQHINSLHLENSYDLQQSQGQFNDNISNVDQTSIPFPYIPDPYDGEIDTRN